MTVKVLIDKLKCYKPNTIVFVEVDGSGCGPIKEVDDRCSDNSLPKIILEG